MPFAVHTTDPGCPVVAIEDTAEKAADSAERLGYAVGTARVMILPCARNLKDSLAVVNETAQLRLALADERKGRQDDRRVADERVNRAIKQRDAAERAIESVRKHTDADTLKRLAKIRDGLSAALDALDPSRLTLTRSGAAEGSA